MRGPFPDKMGPLFIALSIASVSIAYLFLHIDGMMSLFLLSLPVSYIVLGSLIKYGDQAYDVGCFDRRKALALSFPSGIWLGYMMINDMATATIGLGMLIGLLLAGKYDNRGFIVGFLIAIVMAAAGILEGSLQFSLGGAALLVAATFIDERANDIEGVDDLETWWHWALHQRPFLKMAVLGLCAIGVFPSFAYLFMLLSFDFGYSLVDCVSAGRSGRP